MVKIAKKEANKRELIPKYPTNGEKDAVTSKRKTILTTHWFGVNLFSTIPIDKYCDFIETEAIRDKPTTKRRYTWRCRHEYV
jgi:hypothetical protein